MLLEARGEDGRALGDEELFDHMFTLLMAGHETTATTLAWALWLILPRPDVVERIRAEAAAAAAGGPLTPEAAGRRGSIGPRMRVLLLAMPDSQTCLPGELTEHRELEADGRAAAALPLSSSIRKAATRQILARRRSAVTA
jgi:hypothetical protein